MELLVYRMKAINYIIIISTAILIMVGCRSNPVYTPVESSNKGKEYAGRMYRDSIFLYKNKYIYQKGDTVFVVDSVIFYNDRYIRDSIYITDTLRIEIPYPVIETKEVNNLMNWQIILMVLGGALIGYIGFRLIRLFK